MKKLIKKGLMILALSAQVAPVFAGSNDYKPSHGGYSGAPQARRATNLSDLSTELHREIAKFLSPSSFSAFASSCKNVAPIGRDPLVGFRAAKNGTQVYDLQGNIRYTDQKVSKAFADLGKMHKVADLIWSGVAPREMSQRDAVAYCASLGGGARLPTKDEYIALSRAMGSRQPDFHAPGYDVNGYHRNLIPDMDYQWFWSESVHPQNDVYAFVFISNAGDVNYYGLDGIFSVRCVR